jgi:phage terminase large subunit-like protein
MDNPILYSTPELNRILADRNDHLHRCRLHPSPKGCKNECCGIVENGVNLSYELRVRSYELKL